MKRITRLAVWSLLAGIFLCGCGNQGGLQPSTTEWKATTTAATTSAPPTTDSPTTVPTDAVSPTAFSTTIAPKDIVADNHPLYSGYSKKEQGWGQGIQVNSKNQPVSAVNYQKKYENFNARFIGSDVQNQLYFTFDEGYENGYTASILDTLKEKQVKALFFITYSYAKEQPQLVRRMIDEGHQIGNHSTKHKAYPSLTAAQAEEDLQNMHHYIKAQFGYEMTLFRFPEGVFSERDLAIVKNNGYQSVFWSYAYHDWDPKNQMGVDKALPKIEKSLHSGGIYLLHAVSQDNAQLLPQLIDDCRAKGYTFSLLNER